MMKWSEIDAALLKNFNAHPNIKNIVWLSEYLSCSDIRTDQVIYIPVDYVWSSDAGLFRDTLKRFGYNNVIIGREPEVRNFASKLKIILEDREKYDIIFNIDFPIKVRSRILILFRKILRKGRVRLITLADHSENDVWNLNSHGTWEDHFVLSYKQIYDDIKQFESALPRQKLGIAKRIIIDFYYIKDFINLEKWLIQLGHMCNEVDGDFVEFSRIWEEIRDNLTALKADIKKHEHIVLNWIDQLRYDEVIRMPILQDTCMKGLFFDNMYSSTPYTSAVIRNLFFGKDLIDGGLYKINNTEGFNEMFRDSKLIHLLEKYNYEFLGVSTHFNIDMFKSTDALRKITTGAVPSTVLQFEACKRLAEAKNRCFIIIHNQLETHVPKINPLECKYFGLSLFDSIEVRMDAVQQEYNSADYLDKQLKWYDDLYHNARYKIYMSDHGYRGFEEYYPDDELHVLFAITTDSDKIRLKNKRVQEVFGLKSFADILELCITNKLHTITSLSEGFTLVQKDDLYFRPFVDLVIGSRSFLEDNIQFRGIVTEKEVYIKLATGKEYLNFHGDRLNHINDSGIGALVDRLRALAGNRFIDIYRDNKYEAARDFYRLGGLKVAADLEFVE